MAILETEGTVWTAGSGDGPADLSTGESGTWTYSVSNLGGSVNEFEVALQGTDRSTTVEVPARGVATVTVAGSFAGSGVADVAVTVTDPVTGESETLSQSVTVV